MNALAGVVFDLDGTLLDTLDDITNSVNRVLAAEEVPRHRRDTIRGFIGSGVGTLFRRALPEGASDDTVRRCVERFGEDYGRNWNVATRLYDGLPEVIDACVERGLRLAVLSNKPHAFALECVDGFLGRWHWDPVLGDRDRVPRKPDPAGALAIAEAWRVSPERIAFVGDSEIDVSTARNAGMWAIGVAWGFRSREELAAAGAETVVASPAELKAALLDGRASRSPVLRPRGNRENSRHTER